MPFDERGRCALPQFRERGSWEHRANRGSYIGGKFWITRNIVAPALQPLVSPKEGLAAAEGTPGRVRRPEALRGELAEFGLPEDW